MKPILGIGALLAFISCAPVVAQSWPQKPIRIVVAAGAGGSLDIASRAIAEKLRHRLSQPILIENRPAAGGTLAMAQVAKSAPDGHTLAYGFTGPIATAQFLHSQLAYDVERDFAPVALVFRQPYVLGVSAASQISTPRGFIEKARSQPGRLNYSSVGSGSGGHLVMEMLKHQTRVFVVHIPYNGPIPTSTAVATDEVQASFLPLSLFVPHLRSGRVKLIATTSLERQSFIPDVPTMSEAGFMGFEADAWSAILAPRGTSKEIIDRLNREVRDALMADDVREVFNRNSILPARGTPDEVGEFIKREAKKWGEIIKITGAKID